MEDWSYSKDPNESIKDEVRFIVGDTDMHDPLLLDSEIDYLVTKHTTADISAAFAAQAIVAKLSRLVTISIKDEHLDQSVTTKYSDRVKQYTDLMNHLDAVAGGVLVSGVVPTGAFAGGISITDKETRRDNEDNDTKFYRRSMFQSKDLPKPNDDDFEDDRF